MDMSMSTTSTSGACTRGTAAKLAAAYRRGRRPKRPGAGPADPPPGRGAQEADAIPMGFVVQVRDEVLAIHRQPATVPRAPAMSMGQRAWLSSPWSLACLCHCCGMCSLRPRRSSTPQRLERCLGESSRAMGSGIPTLSRSLSWRLWPQSALASSLPRNGPRLRCPRLPQQAPGNSACSARPVERVAGVAGAETPPGIVVAGLGTRSHRR